LVGFDPMGREGGGQIAETSPMRMFIAVDDPEGVG
jgi:hypothetical protein